MKASSISYEGVTGEQLSYPVFQIRDDTSDGYGLNEFCTVRAVPESATMLLPGSGLVGLAALRKRVHDPRLFSLNRANNPPFALTRSGPKLILVAIFQF